MDAQRLGERDRADLRRTDLSCEAISGAYPCGARRLADEAHSLARNSKCVFLRNGVDPWTLHSLTLFAPGPCEGLPAALQEISPSPLVFPRRWTDRHTGEIVTLSRLLRFDFVEPANAALLPLEKVAATLERFPWAAHPGLRVNRLDLASDHLLSDPRQVCDRIAELRLPYSRPYRGPQDAKEQWLTAYHNGGKSRAPGVVVVHYPRLESLLHRHPDASPAARQYTQDRVRQEVRFRGPGLRGRIGGGPMTPGVVFGSFPALMEFAERRLRPVFEAGLLSQPPRDPVGEAALAAIVDHGPFASIQVQGEQPCHSLDG